jgi:hypothetical protein
MFALSKPFQANLMFAGKAGAYMSEATFRFSTLGQAGPGLPTNIRLGWKGSPGANALAYYEKS